MAIPLNLTEIPKDKALEIMRKHFKAGTGYFEYNGQGDFLYQTKRGWYLIRKNFNDTYEKGKVCL